MRPLIYVVDDDERELELTRRAVERRFGADYDVEATQSPVDGLRRLELLAADDAELVLILADMSMPDIGGIDLLSRAAKIQPEAKRVLLITWGELESAREPVMRAVARGDIDGIVAKPWRDAHESFYREISAFVEQWDHVHRPQFEAIKVVADRWDVQAQALRDALYRSGVPFGSYEADSDAGRELLRAAGIADTGSLPVAILYDGRVLEKPSTSAVAAALGLNTDPVGTRYDVTIVGSGPSGLAAAVYAASEGLSVVVIEHQALGGQASSSAMIRNYLGFPRGLSGAELSVRGYRQAWFFGARFVIGRNATGLRADGTDRIVTLDDGSEVRSRAVILAGGVSYRRLASADVDRFVGRGVFYGAPVTEAPGMAGEHVVVVGGGNSSAQMTLYLARFAGRITLVTRNATLAEGMSDYLVRDIESREMIDVRTGTSVAGVEGDHRLTAVRLRRAGSDREERVPAGGLFIMIGAEPLTEWLPKEIARDERGYVATGDDVRKIDPAASARPLETSMRGVFAVGDVRLNSIKRIAAAVGEGSTVVRMCHDYFAER